MRYYPIFLDLRGKKVVFSGAGEHAAAKIRLLLKTEAAIAVYGSDSCEDVRQWAAEGRLTLVERGIVESDVIGATLVYGANDEDEADKKAVALGKAAGALTNIVDDLEASEFLTPAIVDRDPVTVAIGTEGTAPVLARKIKSDVEALLPAGIGILAKIAASFRSKVTSLPSGGKRRAFWSRFFLQDGPLALQAAGEEGAAKSLEALLEDFSHDRTQSVGRVTFAGAGPGDPGLLTLHCRKVLHEADVVLHDNLVTSEILELARREALLVNVGKRGFGKSMDQDTINQLMVDHARSGAHVVRLKGGDTAVFARLDEEVEALESAGIDWHVIPGITAASAAAASAGVSLTRRGRNASLRFLTGHDTDGFADHDWKALAMPGSAAAIYMGKKAAPFIRGRLLMHGADPATPVTIVADASRADQLTIVTTLLEMPDAIADRGLKGPAVLLLGIAARKAAETYVSPASQEREVV